MENRKVVPLEENYNEEEDKLAVQKEKEEKKKQERDSILEKNAKLQVFKHQGTSKNKYNKLSAAIKSKIDEKIQAHSEQDSEQGEGKKKTGLPVDQLQDLKKSIEDEEKRFFDESSPYLNSVMYYKNTKDQHLKMSQARSEKSTKEKVAADAKKSLKMVSSVITKPHEVVKFVAQKEMVKKKKGVEFEENKEKYEQAAKRFKRFQRGVIQKLSSSHTISPVETTELLTLLNEKTYSLDKKSSDLSLFKSKPESSSHPTDANDVNDEDVIEREEDEVKEQDEEDKEEIKEGTEVEGEKGKTEDVKENEFITRP